MKKLLSLILTVIIVVSCVSVSSVYAESSEIINVSGDVYPESEHPYQNELRCTWEYTYPSEAEGLYITFSDDTSLNYNYVYNEEEDEYYYESDYIYLYYYSFLPTKLFPQLLQLLAIVYYNHISISFFIYLLSFASILPIKHLFLF